MTPKLEYLVAGEMADRALAKLDYQWLVYWYGTSKADDIVREREQAKSYIRQRILGEKD